MTHLFGTRRVALAGFLGLAGQPGPARAAAGPEKLVERVAPMPPLTFFDAEGAAKTLDDYKGRALLINLWATWCPPCVAEMPALDRAEALLRGEGFSILPLSSDRGGAAQVRAFYERTGVANLPVLLDPRGAAARALGSRGLPTSIIVNRRGEEVARVEGDVAWDRADVLRYGENPHQRAALYTNGYQAGGLATARQLHGKAMSYNNFVDADAAWRAAHDHSGPAVAIIKHANPCGIAVGADIAQAHARAHACDPLSAYGGVIAANGVITRAVAEQIAPVFTEVVVAPGFEPDALEILTAKKNIRLLVVDAPPTATVETRPISGGLLVQATDRVDAVTPGGGDAPAHWVLAAGEPADAATLADLAFAWRSVRAVKSNAILLASDGASVGVGMGQVNRVDSCRLAVERANAGDVERARGAVAASDAFFPFADGLKVLLDAGVRAVVQPGGSVRDDEVIAAAEAAGATLYLTGTRHFAH